MSHVQRLAPGVIAALIVAGAASFLSEHYDAPVMLFALLLGMALNFLSGETQAAAGIQFAASAILRVGIALLGFRLTFQAIVSLGWQPFLLVVATVLLTLGASILVARALGFSTAFGVLTGGATAICGASAALAISAALPNSEHKERDTLFAVIGVSMLSTLAMIIYPILAIRLNLGDHDAGIFFGATIHDVAQVVGAGYSVSTDAGDTATLVKLTRVAMLLPVILGVSLVARARLSEPGTQPPPLLPWFAIAFLIFMTINSLITLPKFVSTSLNDISRWCLICAIAAIGMKTHLKEIAKLGWRPVILMIGEAVFLATITLIALIWLI